MTTEYKIPAPQFRLLRVSILAGIVGILAGIAAEILDRLIGLVTNVAFYQRLSTELVSPLGSSSPLLLIFIPAVGGLIIGVMAKYGTPLVRGHGIPEAMEAVLVRKSRISPRVALLKPLSAAISIGSGQPFGAEGPIIQTGAAIGSLLGQTLHTTASERKVLLACGAAAGLTAIFGTPIAAIIFSIEILLFEFRPRSFIPLAIANVVAAEAHRILHRHPTRLCGRRDQFRHAARTGAVCNSRIDRWRSFRFHHPRSLLDRRPVSPLTHQYLSLACARRAVRGVRRLFRP